RHTRFSRDWSSDVCSSDLYAVPPVVAHKWAAAAAELADQPGYAQAFMPNGRAPAVGEHFRIPDAAYTLRRIAASGGRDFYEGERSEERRVGKEGRAWCAAV